MSDQQRELHRSTPSYESLRFMAAGTLGAVLLGLSSLTFAGTVIFLILVTPFLIMASPILVPAVIIHVLISAGFLFSGGSGTGALAAMFWMYRNVRGENLFGADQLDFARMRIASKAWVMKERAKEGGQSVQNKAQETTQA
ncbi:oleosin G-like [Nicotiana tabacum]|uniref:Oleosin 1-like n=2 Tax=Nicotiana TaxID=4085 RepID=A0A1S4CVT8_TOBAC|nr:PREDICTED: oleosin 1-like [Nicotiana sylvestris]XP_016505223.1 PREDICTED: oleosin 1-like [Nicotiana tabacum]